MTETLWNKEKLCRLVRDRLAGKLFIVVSNREPYVHAFSGNELTWRTTVGGLTEALDPVLRASGGTWVAQGAGDGVLILSQFTGAAEELQESLPINPYNISEFAATIGRAIEMPETERRCRMAGMRRVVAANNIYRWGASVISRLASIGEG